VINDFCFAKNEWRVEKQQRVPDPLKKEEEKGEKRQRAGRIEGLR
jgi:hypothetical protein